MKITILYNENNGCDYHRLLLPIKHLQISSDDKITIINYKYGWVDEEALNCDILFFSRLIFHDYSRIRELKNKYGFKVVMDIDDYYKLPYNHLIYKSWNKNKVSERIIEYCKEADLIFVTNKLLKDVYSEFNKNIVIVPNSLPFDSITIRKPSNKVRFMYVAGSSHYNDLKLLQGLFKRIDSDSMFQKNGEFVLCGYDNPKNEKDNVWTKMESICKLRKSEYVRRNTLPLNTYMEHYNFGDISIAPLENNLFTNCKSNLKFIEAASVKQPFICSNILPYIEDKTKGIKFCNNTSDWYNSFKFFIKNSSAIIDLGESNYEYAKRKYNITDANEIRLNSFKNILR